jgi:hypothetical protein
VVGSVDGSIWTITQDSSLRQFEIKTQRRITEGGLSHAHLALIDEYKAVMMVPERYEDFKNGDRFTRAIPGDYTRVAADPRGSGDILLWKSGSTLDFPMILRTAHNNEEFALEKLSMRYPVRSASLFENRALFLDTAGNITVIASDTGDVLFTFPSAGALDAAFLDRDTVVIARSAVSGPPLLQSVAIATGETVPLVYPGQVAPRLYRGGSALYAAVVDQGGVPVWTTIIQVNQVNPVLSPRVARIAGEDTTFGIAESDGILAVTLGGEGATLYLPEPASFPRSAGLPLRLVPVAATGEAGPRFISIDSEGNVVWYDGKTGALLSTLHVYDSEWVLERADGQLLRGTIYTP